MNGAITVEKWLTFLRSEYLEDFIKEGGSAIKFAVPVEEALGPDVAKKLFEHSRNLGFLTTRIRADETRIHMVDQIFFRIASDVPWENLIYDVVKRLASSNGYSVEGLRNGALVEELGRVNNLSPKVVLLELRKKVAEEVFAQKRLSRDFRVAMTHLCLARLTGGVAGATTQKVLIDWLTGRNTAIAAVKPYQIFTKITRTNARHFVESILWWLRFADRPGLVVIFEIERLALARNPKDERVHYTKAGVLDAYEVFRQFLDSTDKTTGCLMVVVPHQSFLDEADPRGISAYPALKARIFDEVRDRHLANPMASLVRLASNGKRKPR
jgi:hypothetical protein